jgi:hypothetical protein
MWTMRHQRTDPPPRASAAWSAPPAAAARRGVAEESAAAWGPLEGAPLVDVLRAVYAAGFAEGRRSRGN